FENDETGVIYRTWDHDNNAGTADISGVWANLNDLYYGPTVNSTSSAGGANPHPVAGNNAAFWNDDTATANLIGTRGLGDLEISNDGRYLYTVGLNDRNLYRVPTTETPTTANIDRITIFSGTVNGCANANVRPFGLGVAP